MFWSAEGSGDAGTDSFNPAGLANADDWRVGDEIVLLDFVPEALEPFAGLVSASDADFSGVYKLKEGVSTGWNIDAENMRFGRCGIVGNWWKFLAVEIFFRSSVNVGGIRTDSSPELPYIVECQAKDGEWEVVDTHCTGNTRLSTPSLTRAVRLTWESTDMHQARGLSTMRSGGGLHAEVWLAF